MEGYMNKKRSMKRFKYRSLAWAIVGFACLEASVGNLNAALLWNFVSTDGTDTLTGTLTTDVTDNSIFGAIDPTFPSLADGFGGMVNMIRWSPTLQAIDPVSGLSGSGGIISGEQNVLRAVSPFQEPEGHVNVVLYSLDSRVMGAIVRRR